MSSAKNIFLMVAVFVAVILLWNFLDSVQNGSPDKQSYTEFTRLMDKGRIREVTITQSGQVTGKYVPDGSDAARDFKAVIPTDGMAMIVSHLSDSGVTVEIQNDEQSNWFYVLLSSGLPILLFIGFWIFIMRRMQAGVGTRLSPSARAAPSSRPISRRRSHSRTLQELRKRRKSFRRLSNSCGSPRSSRSWAGEFPRVFF